MIRCVALFAFISCALASAIPDKWQGRIVNGEDTTIEAHPYQASMQTIDGFPFCGAAIINNNTAVTAAHCMRNYPASEIKLRFGSTVYDEGGILVGIRAFRKHNRYNRRTHDFDVAVIKLDTPVSQSSKIRYVQLSTRTPTNGITAVATGWGDECLTCTTYPRILRKVYLNIIGRDPCARNYGYSEANITQSMICTFAANKDTCVGDSGGPLVANNKLVGIISGGAGCAEPDYPGVCCNVATVFKWIIKIANEL